MLHSARLGTRTRSGHGRSEALPVFTLLAPSQRSNLQRGRRHKLLTDWAHQGALQLCRWLPDRDIVFVGDSSFAVHELAHAITVRATLISRLWLDANLFEPPPKCTARSIDRPAQKGAPLPKLKTLFSILLRHGAELPCPPGMAASKKRRLRSPRTPPFVGWGTVS